MTVSACEVERVMNMFKDAVVGFVQWIISPLTYRVSLGEIRKKAESVAAQLDTLVGQEPEEPVTIEDQRIIGDFEKRWEAAKGYLLNEFNAKLGKLFLSMTSAQRDVYNHLAVGYNREEIAEIMDISLSMVDQLLRNQFINPEDLSIPILISLLQNENWEVRYPAAEILGELRATDAVQPLIDVLDTEDVWDVRYFVARALERIATPKALDAVQRYKNS